MCEGRGSQRSSAWLAGESSSERGYAPGFCGTCRTTEGALKLEGSHSPLWSQNTGWMEKGWASLEPCYWKTSHLAMYKGLPYRSKKKALGLKQWRLFSLVLCNLITLPFVFPWLSLFHRNLDDISHYSIKNNGWVITSMFLSFFPLPVFMFFAYQIVLLCCYQSRYGQVNLKGMSLKDVIFSWFFGMLKRCRACDLRVILLVNQKDFRSYDLCPSSK